MQHRKMYQPAEWLESQPAGPQRPAKIPVCKLALDSMGAPAGPAGGAPYPFSRENIHSTVQEVQRERRGDGIPLSGV